MLIDSHCHLHDSEFFAPAAAAQALAEARAAGVERVICIGTNPSDSAAAQQFAAAHEGVYWTYGFHPEYAAAPAFSPDSVPVSSPDPATAFFPDSASDSALLLPSDSAAPAPATQQAANCSPALPAPVAIGEIGLDYHHPTPARSDQIRLFEHLLQLALDRRLPVSLHIREAFPDAFAVLDNFPGLTGVVHSFTGSKRELRAALDRGFYIGVNGLATYTTIPLPPLENMLLETDAPFLTPEPIRGTINSPKNIRLIARYLSEKLGITENLIAEQTTQNVKNLFRI